MDDQEKKVNSEYYEDEFKDDYLNKFLQPEEEQKENYYKQTKKKGYSFNEILAKVEQKENVGEN